MYGRLQGCRCGHQRGLHTDNREARCLRCECAEFVRPFALPPQALTRGVGRNRRRVNRRGLDASSQDGQL